MRGRTVLLITHRSSLLEGCTSLVVLENGRLVSDTTSAPAVVSPAARPVVVREWQARLRSHPAVHAWRQLYPHSEPHRITALKVRRRKGTIYRLEGAGPAGAAVIAKRSGRAPAVIERTVYEEILPGLTVPSLRYYGFLEDSDAERCWLFLEEATGAKYSRLLAADRAQAARWLGLLHTSAAEAAAQPGLPAGGPGRYREFLRSASEEIQNHLDNPMLDPDHIDFLDAMLARLTELDGRWNRLEEICDGAPPTLVHGDFNGKNLRLRPGSDGSAVVVFDWEDGGWGVRSVDLLQRAVPSTGVAANPDIPTYWSTVRGRWPQVSIETLQRLSYCGTVFRALAALYWESLSLATEWASKSVSNMRLFDAELDHALARLGWNGRSVSAHAAERTTADRGS